MRIAFLSDIHGNWDAFNTVLNSPKFLECDVKVFCGDAVGYYYDGARVLAKVHEVFDFAVLGNHDRELLRRLEGQTAEPTYDGKYGSGLNRSMAAIDPLDALWMSSLKERAEFMVGGKQITVCHEAPIAGAEYVYPDSDENIKAALFTGDCDLFVLGHSHYQFVFEKDDRYVLNPGSVGQSRKHGGQAEWASVGISDDDIEIDLHSEKYPVAGLIGQVEHFDPDLRYLKAVLTRIR